MSACYSVEMKVKVLNEVGAVAALQKHIQSDSHADYSLEKYAEQGITTDTFDDLMRIFLAGWKHQELDIQEIGDEKCYSNDFDASYGWKTVMIQMFEIMAPFIEDGSTLAISMDNDFEQLIIQNGKCVYS